LSFSFFSFLFSPSTFLPHGLNRGSCSTTRNARGRHAAQRCPTPYARPLLPYTPHAPARDKTSPCRSTTRLPLIQPAQAFISELNTAASHWPSRDTTCACQLASHCVAAR
jgi:hypothetical protein